MKTVYHFNKKEDFIQDFDYALSPLYKECPKFRMYDEFIGNYDMEDTSVKTSIFDYDYISLISKKKYKDGAKISLKCSFEKFGAPLLVLCDDISEREDGIKEYGLHFEVVAFERGCNVWHIIPFPEQVKKPIKVFKTAFSEFKIEGNEMINITCEVKGKFIHINVNGNEFVCADPMIPSEFHIGFTACEGRNNFYSLTIEE